MPTPGLKELVTFSSLSFKIETARRAGGASAVVTDLPPSMPSVFVPRTQQWSLGGQRGCILEGNRSPPRPPQNPKVQTMATWGSLLQIGGDGLEHPYGPWAAHQVNRASVCGFQSHLCHLALRRRVGPGAFPFPHLSDGPPVLTQVPSVLALKTGQNTAVTSLPRKGYPDLPHPNPSVHSVIPPSFVLCRLRAQLCAQHLRQIFFSPHHSSVEWEDQYRRFTDRQVEVEPGEAAWLPSLCP